MRTETIDRYLRGEMTDDERMAFEQQMADSPELLHDVRTVAYLIHSIKSVGLEEDNRRFVAIRRSQATDRKRWYTSIVAMLVVLFAVAAVVSVPVYKAVIKPMIEKQEAPLPFPAKSQQSARPKVVVDKADTITTDSIMTDTIAPPQPVRRDTNRPRPKVAPPPVVKIAPPPVDKVAPPADTAKVAPPPVKKVAPPKVQKAVPPKI